MTPEGRKEEVIAMFNRIIHSAFFKIDVAESGMVLCLGKIVSKD